MTSHFSIDRLTSSRRTSIPLLPLHNNSHRSNTTVPIPRRSPSQYTMEELEPWPEDDDDVFRDRRVPHIKKLSAPPASLPRSPSPDAWQDRASSSAFGSPPRSRSRLLFAGPPPPIASSIMIKKGSPGGSNSSDMSRKTDGHPRNVRNGFGSLLFDYKHEKRPRYQPDSVWRGLRRREKALENDAQQLLDLQASGLVAGRDGIGPLGSDIDEYSDTGSSTPTGTFYSTATSKSRMVNSLYVPTRSTADGNVIPVRQPKSTKPRGLRSARTGLRKTISALAQLKGEEDSFVDDAIAERRKALGHLEKLDKRRERVSTELHTLEEDEHEPLGSELRKLSTQYDVMTQEIRDLEEKLAGMRTQRRWLRTKMADVKSRRDAGLSGYRGALRDIDSEVSALMQRPPVQPLDVEALQHGQPGKAPSTGGPEFLQMIPERRTLDMAKTWWETEISILEQRKAQLGDDRLALEEGGALWSEVMDLVSDYETRLRRLMRSEQLSSANKGKDRAPSHEELIRDQLPEMEKVMNELEKHQQYAEDKGWNLLICATGAELEAFAEAQDVLREMAAGDGEDSSKPSQSTGTNEQEHHDESSDNEVPPDLLVSRAEDSNPPSVVSLQIEPELKRVESGSENDVPPEFLAEHADDKID